MQVRAGLEKAKQALEKESADLSADLRSLASAKQDLEHKKKKVEGQLNDLHSRFNESERQRTELGERVSKMTVSHKNANKLTLKHLLLRYQMLLVWHQKQHQKVNIFHQGRFANNVSVQLSQVNTSLTTDRIVYIVREKNSVVTTTSVKFYFSSMCLYLPPISHFFLFFSARWNWTV